MSARNLGSISLILTCLLLNSILCLRVPIGLLFDKQQYFDAMRTMNQTETKNTLRALFDRSYNYTQLLAWEHERLNYTNDPGIPRYKDPLQILNYGKGRCQEFSLLYVALCLAHGYQSRFVIDVYGDHTWAEVKLDGVWTHVDPTERRVNDQYMYERDCGKNIELVYAFEDNLCEDATVNYRIQRCIVID